MSYNRWLTPQNEYELYHHGVKGMKWGKHLFGKGAEMPQGAGGGGGGALEDDELNIALDQYKRGEITKEQLDAVYKKIQSLPYRLMHNPGETLNDLAGKTIQAVGNGVDALKRPDEVASHAVQKGRDLISKFSKKKPSESKPAPKPTKTATKTKSQVSKEKVVAKGQAVDADARMRRYGLDVPKRERYRQNGKYRNMNLADVYGPNNKVNDHSGKDGVNLFRQINATDVQNGRNYATRDFDTSKHNDGKYGTRDKIRERITGKADPDNLKSYYSENVQNFERRANQKQAWSVGMEEEFVRKTAAKKTDQYEQRIRDSSLAGLVDRMTPKKRRRW